MCSNRLKNCWNPSPHRCLWRNHWEKGQNFEENGGGTNQSLKTFLWRQQQRQLIKFLCWGTDRSQNGPSLYLSKTKWNKHRGVILRSWINSLWNETSWPFARKLSFQACQRNCIYWNSDRWGKNCRENVRSSCVDQQWNRSAYSPDRRSSHNWGENLWNSHCSAKNSLGACG